MTAMRCKPGDLAVIVRVEDPDGKKHIGTIVRCESVACRCWWNVVPQLDDFKFVHDDCLQPIRGPQQSTDTTTHEPQTAEA